MGKDDDWNVDTLKEHMDKIFELHDKALQIALEEREKAVAVALVELNRRLDILNHAHELAKEKEADFYSRESHEVFAKNIDDKLEEVKKNVEEKIKPKWSIWVGFVTVFALAVAGYYTQMGDLKVALTNNRNDIQSVANDQKVNGVRFDKLETILKDHEDETKRLLDHKKDK